MKRPGLAILLGSMKPKGDPDEEEDYDRDDDYDASGEKKDAAKQVLRAIKDDDAEMLDSALCAFIDLHMSDEDEEESDEEEDRGEHEEHDDY
jgi:hypothetical protein